MPERSTGLSYSSKYYSRPSTSDYSQYTSVERRFSPSMTHGSDRPHLGGSSIRDIRESIKKETHAMPEPVSKPFPQPALKTPTAATTGSQISGLSHHPAYSAYLSKSLTTNNFEESKQQTYIDFKEFTKRIEQIESKLSNLERKNSPPPEAQDKYSPTVGSGASYIMGLGSGDNSQAKTYEPNTASQGASSYAPHTQTHPNLVGITKETYQPSSTSYHPTTYVPKSASSQPYKHEELHGSNSRAGIYDKYSHVINETSQNHFREREREREKELEKEKDKQKTYEKEKMQEKEKEFEKTPTQAKDTVSTAAAVKEKLEQQKAAVKDVSSTPILIKDEKQPLKALMDKQLTPKNHHCILEDVKPEFVPPHDDRIPDTPVNSSQSTKDVALTAAQPKIVSKERERLKYQATNIHKISATAPPPTSYATKLNSMKQQPSEVVTGTGEAPVKGKSFYEKIFNLEFKDKCDSREFGDFLYGLKEQLMISKKLNHYASKYSEKKSVRLKRDFKSKLTTC